MIKITVYQDKKGVTVGFAMRGHAMYAEHGSDIVCAAVSMLAQNTVNSIEQLTDDDFTCDVDEEEGALTFSFSHIPSSEASLLVQSFLIGLQSLEDSDEYESYIDIIFEEVQPA